MKSIRNSGGFISLSTIAVSVVLIVISFVGFYVYRSNKNVDQISENSKNSSQSLVSTKGDKEIYKDSASTLTLRYPKTWSVASSAKDFGDKLKTSTTTISSPDGANVTIDIDYGGKGGFCEPADGDLPHKPGNKCATFEYLSAEKLGVTVADKKYNVDIQKNESSAVPVWLVHTRYTGVDGISTYTSCLTSADKINLNQPEMGLYISKVFIHRTDAKPGIGFYEYVCASESSDPEIYKSQNNINAEAVMRT